MNYKDIVKAFINHTNARSTNSESINGSLISYNTVVAKFADGVLLVDRRNYSSTTSKLTNHLLDSYDERIFCSNEVTSSDNPFSESNLNIMLYDFMDIISVIEEKRSRARTARSIRLHAGSIKFNVKQIRYLEENHGLVVSQKDNAKLGKIALKL